MSEPEMVERVARAICEAGNVDGFRCTCPHPVDGWCLGGRLAMQARAAIEAMRKPTWAMKGRMMLEFDNCCRDKCERAADHIWGGGIEAALEKAKP